MGQLKALVLVGLIAATLAWNVDRPRTHRRAKMTSIWRQDTGTGSVNDVGTAGGNQIAKTQALQCTKEGYFPQPGTCTAFYRCVDWLGMGLYFSTFRFNCPPGTVFDDDLDVCNHPGAVSNPPQCSGAPGAPVPPPPGPDSTSPSGGPSTITDSPGSSSSGGTNVVGIGNEGQVEGTNGQGSHVGTGTSPGSGSAIDQEVGESGAGGASSQGGSGTNQGGAENIGSQGVEDTGSQGSTDAIGNQGAAGEVSIPEENVGNQGTGSIDNQGSIVSEVAEGSGGTESTQEAGTGSQGEGVETESGRPVLPGTVATPGVGEPVSGGSVPGSEPTITGPSLPPGLVPVITPDEAEESKTQGGAETPGSQGEESTSGSGGDSLPGSVATPGVEKPGSVPGSEPTVIGPNTPEIIPVIIPDKDNKPIVPTQTETPEGTGTSSQSEISPDSGSSIPESNTSPSGVGTSATDSPSAPAESETTEGAGAGGSGVTNVGVTEAPGNVGDSQTPVTGGSSSISGGTDSTGEGGAAPFTLVCYQDNKYRRHPLYCNQYYYCLYDGEKWTFPVFTCPAALVFDETTQQCSYPDDTTPCETTLAPFPTPEPTAATPSEETTSESTTLMPAPVSETTLGASPSESTEVTTFESTQETTLGLFIDTTTASSVEATGSTPLETTTVSTTTEKVWEVEASSMFGCPEPGYYPFEGDCIRFYKCVVTDNETLTALLYRCPEGYGYSEVHKRCHKLEDLPPCQRQLQVAHLRMPTATPVYEEDMLWFFNNKK